MSDNQPGMHDETVALNSFLEEAFERQISRSPMTQSYLLGSKENQHRWDNLSEQAEGEAIAEVEQDLKRLRETFDSTKLPHNARLSYKLFEYQSSQKLEADKFRHYNYPVNQLSGWQSEIPAFLINNHRIDSIEDAEAYIQRLEGVKKLVGQIIEGLEERARKGILAPKFVYDYVIRDCRNLIKGVPFESTGDLSPLFDDFRSKIDALDISFQKKPALVKSASDALVQFVEPAYRDLITCAIRLEGLATTDDGVWKLPDGDNFYTFALKQMTTTELTSEEIHEFGLEEVTRIHDEMRQIMRTLNFEGDLQDFFRHANTNPKFTFPNNDEGRNAYLKEAIRVIDEMKGKLSTAFRTLPKADLVVKRVEPFRERSAGLAFYQSPPPDGSRPGIYYVNLFNMEILKKFQLEALAYHEGVPGHHLDRAIAAELSGIPTFQKFGFYTAHAEGWGLYAEMLAKEMGAYRDPMSDFGRLAMELWRATRLVVDTGIHSKRWTREKSIEYLKGVTPNPDAEIVSGIERYIVLPGQATAYKIGMRKILELRDHAKSRLGDKFEIAEFHDVVLTNGPMPLALLEESVESWVAAHG